MKIDKYISDRSKLIKNEKYNTYVVILFNMICYIFDFPMNTEKSILLMI